MFSIPRACQSAESVPKEQKVMLVSLKSKTQCERSRAVLRLSALNGRFPGDESGRIACCPGEIGEVPAPPKDPPKDEKPPKKPPQASSHKEYEEDRNDTSE